MKLIQQSFVVLLSLILGSVNCAAIGSPDYRAYIDGVHGKIALNWHPPRHHERVVVVFQVASDGTVSNVKVKQGKNDSDAEAATKAIMATSPLPALPEGSQTPLEIELTFGIKKSWIKLAGEPPQIQDVDFGPYMASLQKKIKSGWVPPKADTTKRVQVVFKIASGGQLSHLRLTKSSGVRRADEAALFAVQNAAPFDPLPHGAPESVDILFTFDYNVLKGGQLQFPSAYTGSGTPQLYERATASTSPDLPWVKASLTFDECMNIGQVSFDSGDYNAAAGLFERAVALAEQEKPQSAHLGKSLGALADVLIKQGKSVEATEKLKRSMTILEAALGPTHQEIGNDLEKLALIHCKSDRIEAEYCFKRCISVREKAIGPKSVAVAKTKRSLAHMYNEMGRYDEAQTLLTQSLAILDKAPDCPAADRINTLEDLLIALKATNQPKKVSPVEARLNELRKLSNKGE